MPLRWPNGGKLPLPKHENPCRHEPFPRLG
jgi:hypothetical protein